MADEDVTGALKLCKLCEQMLPASAFEKQRRQCRVCRGKRKNALQATPERRARRNALSKSPEARAKKAAYNRTPERKAYGREYERRPKPRARKQERQRKPKWKTYSREYEARAEVRVRRRRKEHIRRQAEGTYTPADIVSIHHQQRSRCAICRKKFKDRKFHIDHIVPIARGGTNWPRNLQLLCPSCNLRKHAKDPIDHMRELGRLL